MISSTRTTATASRAPRPVTAGAGRADAIRVVRRHVAEDGLNHANGAYALLRGGLLLLPLAPSTVLVLTVDSWWAWLAHVVVATTVLCTLPSVYHECAHGNLSRNRIVNDLVGTVAATLHFTPFTTWRYFHLAHHANTGTDQDPEVYPTAWSRWTLLAFPLGQWAFVRILWKWSRDSIAGAGPAWIRTQRQRAAIRLNAAFVAVAWTALIVATVLEPRLVGLLLVPCALSLMLASLTLVPEHFPAYRIGPGEPDQLDRTNSFQSNPAARLLLWNSNFHAAHHFAPKVPAHHLPQVDRLISEIQDPRWRWAGYCRWYAQRLRQLAWRPVDISAQASSGMRTWSSDSATEPTIGTGR